MNLAVFLERHRRSLLFVAFALALAGLFAGINLPIGLFPATSFPRIRIEIDAGSRPAKQMLIDVTEPLEAVVRAVPGALDVTSTTSRGSAEIFVDFPWGANMTEALLSVDAAFAQALPGLPQGTSYTALQMSPTAVFPFVSYALISDTVSPADLRRLAQFQIAPLLTGIAGIRKVGILGGQIPEVQVKIDAQKLQAFGLTLDGVTKMLAETNTITAVGRLEDNDLLYLTLANDALSSVKTVRDIILKGGKDGVVRLGDVAEVGMGTAPQWLLVDDNGKPAVTFDVFQQDSASSLDLAQEVQARLDGFMKSQPKSIRLYRWYDQTQLVRSSIAALIEAIAIGLVFAAFVIWRFLRNARATLVAVMVVPLAVLITVLLLSLFGLTFNIMTLGGIAAAIGLLIDDVIVMIEHIARRAGVATEQHSTQVLKAAKEFLAPLAGSSLATIIIFVPLAFLSGITGAFFKFLSLTMASSLIISWLLTVLIVPLLARGIIDFTTWRDPDHERETRLRRWHGRVLATLSRHPLLIALGIIALIGAGAIAYTHVKTGFLPRMDEGGFVLDYQSKPGTSLAETNRELEEVEAILKKDPDVDTFSRRTGAGIGGDFAETYQGDLFVHLVDPGRRPAIWQVMDRITKEITDRVPGLSFDTHQLLGDMIGDMVGRRQPVVVQLSAKDPDILGAVADRVARTIAKVPGVEPASVNNGVVPSGDALQIHVDPAAAAMEGLTPADVQAQVKYYLRGVVATRYMGNIRDVGVRLRLQSPESTITRDRLDNLPIRSPKGPVFPLATVARIAFVAGQPQINRNNLAQVVDVTAEMSGATDLGSTIAGVKAALQRPGLIPPGVFTSIGGAYRQQQMAAHGMIKVFAAAAAAEVVLLLFLYEDFLIPLIILATSLVSTGAVFVGLWLTGVELNIMAMMGMIMIVGIATEMAIFLVSEYQALKETMPPREALHEAALNRLRPITMSTLAMILALLPLGIALSGAGDQMLQPLAIAIIAGITVQLPLVLLALPVAIGLTLPGK